ncbi:shikimate O-hydroxycinnamoyltransferase [Tanacetum coccineum]
MALVDNMGWKLRKKQWTGTNEQLIRDLESAYDNDLKSFCSKYAGQMYVNDLANIFDMVDIDLFNVVALNKMVLRLGYTEEGFRCLATLVRSFKLIEVYIEHGVTVLDSYLRAPRLRATIEEITNEPGSIAANRSDKILFFTWHESSDTTKEPACDSITPSTLPQLDSSSPCKDYVIDDVIRQLSFEETKLDGDAGFADVVESGVASLGLSHDELFGVDDLDLNLNEHVNLNVSQIETQSELLVSEEPDVGRNKEPNVAEVSTPKPIVADVSTQEPIVAELSTQVPIVADVGTQVPIVEEVGTQEFTVEDVVLEDFVSSGEDAKQYQYDESAPNAGTNDEDDDFLVDEENEIIEPGVDVYLFGISMVLPFDKIGVTNLVPDDVLDGEDADVINVDGFSSDPGNVDETVSYRRRRLGELRTKMEGVINASGKWKYSFYAGQKFTTPKEAKDKIYLHSIESRMNLKLYKNDKVRIRAKCKGKVPVFTMSQGTNDDSQASSSVLDTHDKGRDLLGLDGAFMKEPFPGQLLSAVGLDSNNEIYPLAYVLVEVESKSSWCWFLQCLGNDKDLHPNSNFTFISDRKKGWCRQAYKDLLWRAASTTNVRDFDKCMLELKTMNPKAHEWLNKIPAEHWARFHFSGSTKSNLLLNNICEVFNGKIVGGRDKPVIILLEYIMEYCMKRIMNVKNVIDKCTGPLTPTATRIMESIKKETHLMKVQRNRANKYQVSASTHDQCVRKWELTGIPCRNNAEASGRSSRQAQQTELAVCQDGSGGSGAGVVIGLSADASQVGASAASQGSSHSKWTKSRIQTQRLSPQKELSLNLQVNLLLVLKCHNSGVTCEEEAKRRNSGDKKKTFDENHYMLLYAISNKEDTAYLRQLITRIRVMINSRFGVSTNHLYAVCTNWPSVKDKHLI